MFQNKMTATYEMFHQVLVVGSVLLETTVPDTPWKVVFRVRVSPSALFPLPHQQEAERLGQHDAAL